MLRLLCEQLGIHANTTAIGSLKALYQNADRTLANHRAWVREKLGLAAYDTSAEERLRAALSQQAIDAASVDELSTSAEQWLFDNKIVLPGTQLQCGRLLAQSQARHGIPPLAHAPPAYSGRSLDRNIWG